MNEFNCGVISPEERLDLARRSGQLLLSLAAQQIGDEPIAAAICSDNLVAEIIEGKHALPINGLQWLRAVEAQCGGIDWYQPSLLTEVAAAFQSHIGGVVSAESQQDFDTLEQKAQSH
jgi:hypothetical protein